MMDADGMLLFSNTKYTKWKFLSNAYAEPLYLIHITHFLTCASLGSGEMDFTEFILATYNYCTFNKYALIRFAFELYDADSSGAIDTDEMSNMLKDVYGKSALKKNKQAQYVLEKISILGEQATGDMEVPYPLFEDFCNKHPALLFPAFILQSTLRNKIIGERFWKRLESKRESLQKKVRKESGVDDGEDVNFREVMQYLSSLSEADRENALNQAMEDAIEDIGGSLESKNIAQREVNRLSRMAGSKGANLGRRGLRRSRTLGSKQGGGSAPSIYAARDARGKRHDSVGSRLSQSSTLRDGGKSWRCQTCGRTNYPSDSRCKTCRKVRGGTGAPSRSGSLQRRTTGKPSVDWASAGF